MSWRSVVVPLVVVASLVLLPVGVVFAQPQPPGPIPVLEKRFPVTPPSGPYDEILLVLDMAPGTTFPLHAHGGPVVLTVVEGTLWERSSGRETVLNPGDTLVEETGRQHEAGNRGAGRTRLLITVLLPKGALLSTDMQTHLAQDLPPGATVVGQAMLENPAVAAPLDVVLRVADLPVGGVVPPHTHPGPNLSLAVAGEFTLTMPGMSAQRFRAGEMWVEPATMVHSVTNAGSVPGRLMGSGLVPRGAPVATPVQPQIAAGQPAAAPGPGPSRQMPGRLPRTGDLPVGLAVLGLLGVSALGGGWVSRLRRRR